MCVLGPTDVETDANIMEYHDVRNKTRKEQSRETGKKKDWTTLCRRQFTCLMKCPVQMHTHDQE